MTPRPAATLDDVVQVVLAFARTRVKEPQQVRVETIETGRAASLLRLQVAPDDVGRIIGKGGRTIRVVREIASTMAAQLGLPPVVVDVADTSRGGESR